MKSNFVPIETDILAKLARENGGNTKLSQALGHDGSYVNKAIKKGIMAKSAAILIEKMYGVDIIRYKQESLFEGKDKVESSSNDDINEIKKLLKKQIEILTDISNKIK